MNSMSGPSGSRSTGNAAGDYSRMLIGTVRSGKDKFGKRGEIYEGDKIPKGYRAGQIQQFTPEMMELFDQIMGMLGPESDIYKMAIGDQSAFDEMEAPAWRKFQESQGQLGSRFSQLSPGAMSATRGSGFQNQAGQLGNDFAMGLASKRQELQRQSLMDLMGLSNLLLNQKPYERTFGPKQQKEPGFWDQLGNSFAQTAGKELGSFGSNKLNSFFGG